MTVITKPLTRTEVQKHTSEDDWLEIEVLFDLNDIINNDLEGFLDLICDKVGVYQLNDIQFSLSGVSDSGEAIILVQGDVSDFLNEE